MSIVKYMQANDGGEKIISRRIKPQAHSYKIPPTLLKFKKKERNDCELAHF